jgi:hypothetical protein
MSKEQVETFHVEKIEEWRKWLEKNHSEPPYAKSIGHLRRNRTA